MEPADRAEPVIRALIERRITVAAAESLTGGLLCAVLTSVPGASAVVRGGVVVYGTDLKVSLAGVDETALRRHGPVAAETALAMAAGVRDRLHADVGVATTGVAGPDRQDDLPPGTVHVAVAGPDGARCVSFVGSSRLAGDRAEIRAATVDAALELLRRELAEPES